MVDLALFERIFWLSMSAIGAVILGALFYIAVGDLRLRKKEQGAPRSSILLAWQRVVFDGLLLLTMLVDTFISLISFQGGNGVVVLAGLDLDKISMVALAVYLAWNRRQVKKYGDAEFDPSLVVPIRRMN